MAARAIFSAPRFPAISRPSPPLPAFHYSLRITEKPGIPWFFLSQFGAVSDYLKIKLCSVFRLESIGIFNGAQGRN